MKARYVASFALVAALVAVSTAAARTDSPTRASASKITVWLQVDAQTGWPDSYNFHRPNTPFPAQLAAS